MPSVQSLKKNVDFSLVAFRLHLFFICLTIDPPLDESFCSTRVIFSFFDECFPRRLLFKIRDLRWRQTRRYFFYDVLDFSFLQFYKKRKLETESNQTTKKKNDQRFSYFVSFHSNSSVRQRNNYVVSFSFDHNEQFELRSRKFRENQKDNKLTFTSTASFWTTNVTREEINYFSEE